MSDLSPMLFTVAPNGARLGKTDHPALPISPDELATCAEDCVRAGAGMIHLHVRDDAGKHILDATGYRDAIQAIRKKVGDDIVIQVTTEAVGMYKNDAQMALVHDLKPEAVSLGLRELLPEGGDEKEFETFWKWLKAEHIWPQVILYDDSDVLRLMDLRNRGVLGNDHLSILFVLGRYGKQQAEATEILPFLTAIEGATALDWSVCAFGKKENACITAAACLGGHARVGFENNRYLPDGEVARDNTALIEQAVTSARGAARSPITGYDLRHMRNIR